MDRNGLGFGHHCNDWVALRKESVDRNLGTMQIVIIVVGSLSARRAWIEINVIYLSSFHRTSLSARRAWIEIMDDLEPSRTRKVALRKESVDRNRCAVKRTICGISRSPQGERG